MGLVYTYKIPPDHGAGTFWYHAHFHEHTTAQVTGGAFGMLIIEERDDFATNAGVLTWLNRTNERLLTASRIVLSSGSIQYRGNGEVSHVLPPIIANSWYRLRVLTLDPNAATATLVVGGSSCEVRAVAYDGVWRSSIPSSSRSNTYTMTGASRIDVAIKCSSGSHVIQWNGGAVATLVATSGTPTVATPYVNSVAWSPARPSYLQSLTNSIYNTNTARILVTPTCVKLNPADSTCRSTDQWNAATPAAAMQYDTVRQWDISANGLGPHSFHLHIYHVQVVGTHNGSGGNKAFGVDCGHHKYGEWYDVISGFCIVRFRMIDFGGRVVLHCHVLKHGDDGSMTWINVTDGPPIDRTLIDPMTLQPTQRPTTRQPTQRPTTSKPTTRQPTRRPTTRRPTTPTQRPTTSKPTTRQPTQRPTISKPTQGPVTSNPTPMPTSPRPTTSQPTSRIPSTSQPSSFHPTSSQPTTLKPSTVQSTSSPETDFSPKPSTIPSAETPTTSPTERPSTARPTESHLTATPVTTLF